MVLGLSVLLCFKNNYSYCKFSILYLFFARNNAKPVGLFTVKRYLVVFE